MGIWTDKPPLGSQINWANPLSKGLVACTLLNEGGGDVLTNLVTQRVGIVKTSDNGHVWVTKHGGLGIDSPGNNIANKAASVYIGSNNQKMTFLTIFRAESTGRNGAGNIFDRDYRLMCLQTVATNTLRFTSHWAGGTTDFTAPNDSIVLNRAHTAVVTAYFRDNAANCSIYVDGKVVLDDATATPFGAHDNISGDFYLGDCNGTDRDYDGQVFLFYAWNRILTKTEIAHISAHPYCVIQRPKLRVLNLPYPLALCWGEETPTDGETAKSWQTWDDGAGGAPTVSGDADWGKLSLATSAIGHGSVEEVGIPGVTRIFTITSNKYGTGSGSFVVKIRGADTIFAQDDASPSWETYSGTISRQWCFVQVRLEGG
jgi:hypothetical protein